MGYNYSELSDFEFEKLACDIVSKITGVELSCYAPGRDGGVDASDYRCDDWARPSVIVQAKRWNTSTAGSKLAPAMRKLASQLLESGRIPKTLVLVIACPLSEKKQQVALSVLRKVGADECWLLDGTKLDQFLDDARNACILRRHFKLWIAGTGILQEIFCRDVFVDCEMLLADAQSQTRHYVQTSLYDEAIENLESGAALIVVGGPGTGKTVLTKMLALHAAADGYRILFSTSNDCAGLKRSLSPDDDAKELIILDDFLGQRYLDLESRQLKEIVSLVLYIERSANRRIILNSRISILNEARRRDQFFDRLFDDFGSKVLLINTEEISLEDRARILLANLQRFNMPDGYISALCQRREYGQIGCQIICQHRNYNPRIIEYCASPTYYEQYTCEEFFGAVCKTLENPEMIWANEFEERLEKRDRLLLFQLHSLTDLSVPLSVLCTAFEARIALESDIDTSVDVFGACIKRLEKGMIRTVLVHGEKHVSVINPSVNDYLSSCLKTNSNEARRIVRAAEYSDQLERIASINKSPMVIAELEKRLDSDSIDSMATVLGRDECTAGHLINVFIANNALLVPSRFNHVILLLSKALGVHGASSVDKLLRLIREWQVSSEAPCTLPALGNPLVLIDFLENYSYECMGTMYDIYMTALPDDSPMAGLVESLFAQELDEWAKELAFSLVHDEIGSIAYLYDDAISTILACSEDYDPEDEVRGFVRDQLELYLPVEDYMKASKETFGNRLFSLYSEQQLIDAYDETIDIAVDDYSPWGFQEKPIYRSKKSPSSVSEEQAVKAVFRAWIEAP